MNFAHCRHLLLVCCMAALTACGFHLRGVAEPAFKSVHIEQHGASTIARTLQGSGVQVLPAPQGAEMHLELSDEQTRRNILSLSGDGRVREYELVYQVTVRLRQDGEALWSAPRTVESRRDYSYDDLQRLAKETEEARLYNDMRSEAVREIMRQLSALRSGRPGAAH